MFHLISVIVPIYNGEKWLSRCIDSILNQSFQNIEIILVNDGSVDRSLDLCYKYATKDERIIVINQSNSGVSVARNRGISEAKGDYIMFVDCDDWLEADTLNVLYDNMIAKNVDFSVIGYKEISEKGQIYTDTATLGFKKIMSRDDFMKLLFQSIGFFSLCYPWGKLYKRRIIVENKLQFDSRIAIGEDRLFLFDYSRCTYNGIFCSSDSFYNYFINLRGAMRNIDKNASKKLLSAFKAMDIMRGKINGTDEKLEEIINHEYINMLLRYFGKIEGKERIWDNGFIKELNSRADYYLRNISSISLKDWIKLFAVYKLHI